MCIRIGSTRFVLLTKRHAIKIARIRPIGFLFRILLMIISKKRFDHFLLKYGPGFKMAILRDILAGFYSNKNEYYYFQRHKDSRVAPTESILLTGLIVIQPRGVDILSFDDEIKIPNCINGQTTEIEDIDQFKKIGGEILLVDYGRTSTIEALKSTL